MESFHTANDAALWSFGEDQSAAWSEMRGAAQPTHEFSWGLDGPLGDIDWDFTAFFENPTNSGTTHVDPVATRASPKAFDANFTDSQAHPSYFNGTHSDLFSSCHTSTPSFTNEYSIASSQNGTSWGSTHSPTEAVANPYGAPIRSSSATLAIPTQPEFSWFEIPGQLNNTTSPYLVSDGGVMGPYLTYTDLSGSSCTAVWGPAELNASALGVADAGVVQTRSPTIYMPESSSSALRKRPRDADGTSSDRDKVNDGWGRHKKIKRSMACNGVSGAAWHASRARRQSSTRTPAKSNDKSEAAGRGAGGLAAMNAHEVYHRFLLGPSDQKEPTEVTAQGKLPWVEGREQDVTWQHEDSAVQPQETMNSARDEQQEEGGGDLFKIPKRLSGGHRGLLKATPEEWARGAVREPKCRLCPGAAFSNWEGFKRHCDRTEAHPLELSFCGYCGDCFARDDSLKRHRTNRPPECRSATPEEALAKQRAIERVHGEFLKELERCLGTEEVIATPFVQTIKDMFPGSSKRGSRQQSRLKAPKSGSS